MYLADNQTIASCSTILSGITAVPQVLASAIASVVLVIITLNTELNCQLNINVALDQIAATGATIFFATPSFLLSHKYNLYGVVLIL